MSKTGDSKTGDAMLALGAFVLSVALFILLVLGLFHGGLWVYNNYGYPGLITAIGVILLLTSRGKK